MNSNNNNIWNLEQETMALLDPFALQFLQQQSVLLLTVATDAAIEDHCYCCGLPLLVSLLLLTVSSAAAVTNTCLAVERSN